MNNQTIINQGQSFLDKVVQGTGSIENAFEMAMLNDIAVTEELEIGNSLHATTLTNKYIANQWQEGKEPATEFEVGTNPLPEGIEYWAMDEYLIQ